MAEVPDDLESYHRLQMMEASRYLFQTLRPALRPLRKESTLFYTQHIARRPLSVSSATPRETSRQDPTPLLRRNLRSNPLGGRLLLARGQLRQNTTSSEAHPPPEEVAGTPASPPRVEGEGSSKIDVPSYDITFTCKPCFHRAAHRISKQGYHKGTVIITCPKCSARHLISDHLRVRSVACAALCEAAASKILARARYERDTDPSLSLDLSRPKRDHRGHLARKGRTL